MAFVDSGDGSGSSKGEAAHPEIILGRDNTHVLLILGEQPENDGAARKSTSSSSVSSSEEDFFQLDATDLSIAMLGTSEAVGDDLIFPRVTNDLQLLPLVGTEEAETSGTPAPILQGNVHLLDVSHPPVVQEMVRSDVPDPYRIPSSVFERNKSTAPTDWSVASNESLFSIHMGNSSFSRDHVILMGKSEEMSAFSSLPPPQPVKEREPPLNPEEVNAEAMKDVLRAAADERAKGPTGNIPLYASASHRSNGSTTSINSFAFPILTGDGRSTSVRVMPDKQQNQRPEKITNAENLNNEGAPVAAKSSWCSCFPCSYCC